MPPTRWSDEQRKAQFLARLRVVPGTGCYEWPGAKAAGGYGAVGAGGRRVIKAHRYAYELARGPIPAGLWVLHLCDNPPCCNPEHLYLGTHRDNVRDRDGRGRTARTVNERNARTRLTVGEVQEIRRLAAQGTRQRAIAARYRTTQAYVSLLVTRKRRVDVPEQVQPWG